MYKVCRSPMKLPMMAATGDAVAALVLPAGLYALLADWYELLTGVPPREDGLARMSDTCNRSCQRLSCAHTQC